MARFRHRSASHANARKRQTRRVRLTPAPADIGVTLLRWGGHYITDGKQRGRIAAPADIGMAFRRRRRRSVLSAHRGKQARRISAPAYIRMSFGGFGRWRYHRLRRAELLRHLR